MYFEQFAKHILVNLRGIPFVETLQVMRTAGDKITLSTLRKRLEQRGLHVPRGAVHLGSIRLWLAQAGIFDASVKAGPRLYQVDQKRLNQVLGVSLDAIDGLAQLNGEQRAFLRALTRIADSCSICREGGAGSQRGFCTPFVTDTCRPQIAKQVCQRQSARTIGNLSHPFD